jgi:anti-sigma regulatory factor (Ser/Thr protein kinase)
MPGRRITGKCRWRLPADAAVLPLVRASVSRMVADAAERDLERIRLAVTEACANVVRHAYPNDPGVLDVGVCLGPKVLMIEVRDCGVGVPDEPEPRTGPAGGLGLPLIDMLADRVEITPRAPGTSVKMRFDLN